MDDINTVYALLVLIMFFVLLSRLDNRFGKIERELNEIKKRMDDYLKVQQRGVTEKVKPEGEALKKENEDISASPQIIEKTSTLETKQQKETVPEKQKPVVETVIREALEGTREKTVETELEDVCVEAVPRQKKQVNFVCGIQSARTGHHFTCRRISCTFHRKQWRGKLSGTVHLCKYPESRYVRTFHL